MAIILVMLAVSLPYIFSYESLYKSEEQSLKIMDLIRRRAKGLSASDALCDLKLMSHLMKYISSTKKRQATTCS